MDNKATKVKFRSDDEKQLQLGVDVLVAAHVHWKKTGYFNKAVGRALKKFDVRDIAMLPRQKALERHLSMLEKAISSGKSPEDGTHGYQKVIKMAYDKITNGQVTLNEIPEEDKKEAVNVPAVDAQEDQMEKDAEQARAEMEQEAEQVKEQEPVDELPFPEEFDIWQSDAYSFLTAFCKYSPEGDGAVTMPLKAFEMLFRRQYGRRNIA